MPSQGPVDHQRRAPAFQNMRAPPGVGRTEAALIFGPADDYCCAAFFPIRLFEARSPAATASASHM